MNLRGLWRFGFYWLAEKHECFFCEFLQSYQSNVECLEICLCYPSLSIHTVILSYCLIRRSTPNFLSLNNMRSNQHGMKNPNRYTVFPCRVLIYENLKCWHRLGRRSNFSVRTYCYRRASRFNHRFTHINLKRNEPSCYFMFCNTMLLVFVTPKTFICHRHSLCQTSFGKFLEEMIFT